MQTMTKADFLGAFSAPIVEAYTIDPGDPGSETVDARPARGVYFRQLAVKERSAWEKGYGGFKDPRSAYLVRVLCDEQGRRLFEDGETETVGGLIGPELDRLFWAAMHFNKMTAADVAELSKNLKAPPSN